LKVCKKNNPSQCVVFDSGRRDDANIPCRPYTFMAHLPVGSYTAFFLDPSGNPTKPASISAEHEENMCGSGEGSVEISLDGVEPVEKTPSNVLFPGGGPAPSSPPPPSPPSGPSGGSASPPSPSPPNSPGGGNLTGPDQPDDGDDGNNGGGGGGFLALIRRFFERFFNKKD
jgi:hypothetical protein